MGKSHTGIYLRQGNIITLKKKDGRKGKNMICVKRKAIKALQISMAFHQYRHHRRLQKL